MTTIISGPRKAQADDLRSAPYLRTCGSRELRAIAGLGTRAHCPAGTYLTRRGQFGLEFFMLVDGEVACRVGRTDVARLRAGDYFGEMSLIDGGRRTADVVAVTDVTVLVFAQQEFASLLEVSPAIRLKLMTSLAGRLRRANEVRVPSGRRC